MITLLSLLGCGDGGGGDETAQLPDQNACDIFNLRIISGTPCAAGTSPVVKITVRQPDESTGVCSGTLISPTQVISAAHCLYPEDFSGVLRSGAFLVTFDTGATARVSSVVPHPSFLNDFNRIIQAAQSEGVDPNGEVFEKKFVDYVKRLGLSDVSILNLTAPVTISPASLHLSDSPVPGTIISIFGYGITDNNSTQASPVLRSGEMSIDDNGSKNLFARFDATSSDTCRGDSGGPAFIQEEDDSYAVAGTTLGGGINCVPGDISIFTMLSGVGIGEFIRGQAPTAITY